MARDDGRPMGIAELRRRWPEKYAMGAMVKVPDGAYLSMSTDLPADLAAEVIGKVTWYMGGHDWRQWAPDKNPSDLAPRSDESSSETPD